MSLGSVNKSIYKNVLVVPAASEHAMDDVVLVPLTPEIYNTLCSWRDTLQRLSEQHGDLWLMEYRFDDLFIVQQSETPELADMSQNSCDVLDSVVIRDAPFFRPDSYCPSCMLEATHKDFGAYVFFAYLPKYGDQILTAHFTLPWLNEQYPLSKRIVDGN